MNVVKYTHRGHFRYNSLQPSIRGLISPRYLPASNGVHFGSSERDIVHLDDILIIACDKENLLLSSSVEYLAGFDLEQKVGGVWEEARGRKSPSSYASGVRGHAPPEKFEPVLHGIW